MRIARIGRYGRSTRLAPSGCIPARLSFDTALVLIATAGIFLRVLRYVQGRSLWLDEIFLANNLIHKNFLQLLQPLDYRQGAPPFFLLLCKLAIACLGTSEHALRLVPLIAGIGSVILFALLARQMLSGFGALAALTLFALLEPLIYYSSELKQYSTDVLVAVAVLWAISKLAAQGVHQQRTPWLRLFVIGLIGIFFSHPAIFVIGGVSLWLISLRKYNPAWLAGLFAGWAIAGVVDYFFFLKPLESNGGLQHHWAAAYPPFSKEIIGWLWHACQMIFAGYNTMWLRFTMFGAWPAYAAMVLAVIGCFNLYRRGQLGLVAWPLILTLLASLLRKYPFDDRLILFLVPMVVLMIAASLEGPILTVPTLLFGYVIISCLGREFVFALHPPGREEIQPVMSYLKNHWQPGDTLYLYRPADTAFLYYRNQMGLDDLPYIPGQWQSGQSDEEIRALAGHPRVWILFSHVLPTPVGDERAELQQVLAHDGAVQIQKFEAPGAGIYLYRMVGR